MILESMGLFIILNDSTCQFYYKVHICLGPYKKSGRGVRGACIIYIFLSLIWPSIKVAKTINN